MITIIDYGLGNIQAFVNVYRRFGYPVNVANNISTLQNTTKLILPGVGAFDYAMELLNASGMRHDIEKLVFEKKVPILGVCVGMQILADSSEEGKRSGLGWIRGDIKSIKRECGSSELLMPHMGWNDVSIKDKHKLFIGFPNGYRFYFLHSYYFDPINENAVVATTKYGLDFCCAVQSENIYGVQFHPEKSHHYGTTLLKNFAEL